MATASEAADLVLLHLDPIRGIRTISAEFERLSELDPKLRAAKAMLEERLRGIVEDDPHNIVAPLLWLFVRGRLTTSHPPSAICDALRDGDTMLRAAEAAMSGVFRKDALREVIRQGMQLAAADSGTAAELQKARDELRRLAAEAPEDFGPIIIVPVLAGIGLAVVYGLATRGEFHISLH